VVQEISCLSDATLARRLLDDAHGDVEVRAHTNLHPPERRTHRPALQVAINTALALQNASPPAQPAQPQQHQHQHQAPMQRMPVAQPELTAAINALAAQFRTRRLPSGSPYQAPTTPGAQDPAPPFTVSGFRAGANRGGPRGAAGEVGKMLSAEHAGQLTRDFAFLCLCLCLSLSCAGLVCRIVQTRATWLCHFHGHDSAHPRNAMYACALPVASVCVLCSHASLAAFRALNSFFRPLYLPSEERVHRLVSAIESAYGRDHPDFVVGNCNDVRKRSVHRVSQQ
jgi:hypothetical protein